MTRLRIVEKRTAGGRRDKAQTVVCDTVSAWLHATSATATRLAWRLEKHAAASRRRIETRRSHPAGSNRSGR